MSIHDENYANCSVIIKSKNNLIGVQRVIVEYDRHYRNIDINGDLGNIKLGEQVTVLIVLEDALHEYKGVVRGASAKRSTVSLYQGTEKENRAAQRYLVNQIARVENLVLHSKTLPMQNHLEIFVANISTTGALLKGKPNYFNQDLVLGITIDIGGKSTALNSKVVRIRKLNESEVEYGCKFI